MRFKGTWLKTLFVIGLTIGAVVFAAENFRQRVDQKIPDDGVVWVDGEGGVFAQRVQPESPASNAGIRPGNYLRAIYYDNAWEEIRTSADVGDYLDAAGVHGSLVYQVERINSAGVSMGLWEGDVKDLEPLPVNTPRDLYFALIAMVYLAIGAFVFLRQGRAPYSFHFFWICFSAYLFYILKPTFAADPKGEWLLFDRIVFLADNISLLFAAPLFLHFCGVFPNKPEWISRHKRLIPVIYIPAIAMSAVEVSLMAGQARFAESLAVWRGLLDTASILQFSAFLLFSDILLISSYLRARTPALRLQLKWITWGVGLASASFAVFYASPYLLGPVSETFEAIAIAPLILVPLSFGYSIVRYRMMDVDVIVRRSFVHVLVTGGVGALYLFLLLAVGDTIEAIDPTASTWVARAVTVGVMLLITVLFAPVNTWLQQTADRLFYGERYTLRKGLGEFGRALASTSEIDPLLDSLAARLKRMLSVEQLAIFVEHADAPRGYRLMLDSGLLGQIQLPEDFSRWVRANAIGRGYALIEEEGSVGAWGGIHYLVPCIVRDRMIAVIGVGRQASDGSLVTSEDLEILRALSGYVAVAIDNSLLLQSEREKAARIAHLKQFSESIIESVNVGILVIGRSGRITVWNSALEEMLGISRSEAVGAEALELFNEEMIETVRQVTGTSEWVVDDIRHVYKFHTHRRDQSEIVINLSLAPFEDTAHTLAGTLCVVEDVTNRIKLEDQLQQSDKLNSIGLLAAGVAHEVNTPLAGISSYTQMLLQQIPEGDPKHVLLEKVLTQTRRASDIANNLLNFSRTSGSDFNPIAVNRILDDTLQLLELQLRKNEISIVRNFADDLPEAYGNAGKLQQVFMNLILNARDAMPGGGTLEIETESSEHTLFVRIKDSGIGIAPENIAKIYDPFFTTKSVGQGTGLGLAVSYGIVQEHSGRIFVESAPGKGTIFTIKLPSRYRRMQAASD